MTTMTDRYTRDLLLALHRRDVSGARIGDILAEVDSHVADTGEDPTEAFGPPGQYAAAIAPESDTERRSRFVGHMVQAILGGISGWLLSVSVINLIQGQATVYGLPAWSLLIIGLAVAAVIVAATTRPRDRIQDPRSGKAIAPSQGVAFVLVVGTMTAVVAVLAALLI